MSQRLLFLLLLTFSVQSIANMSRGAHESGNSSTLSLNNHKTAHLVVNKENLLIKCEVSVCKITATYYIASKNNLHTNLHFLSPRRVSKPVVWINSIKTTVKITKPSNIKRGAKNSDYHSTHHQHEVRHSFRAAFKRGNNIVKVSYQQNMSMYTASSFGMYPFLSRKYNTYFAYYLYPLKQWKLAPDFSLSIRLLTVLNNKIQCAGIDKTAQFIKPNTVKISGQYKQLDFIFGRKFPGTLECHTGRKATKRIIRKRFKP